MLRRAAALAAVLVVGACTHPVVPAVVPVRPAAVQSAAGEKLPGRWLLAVDAAAMDVTLRSRERLDAHGTYPISASGPFREAALAMIATIVESVELVPADQPMQADTDTGRIVIRVERFVPVVSVRTAPAGRLSTEQVATAVATLSATLSAQRPDGRSFRTAVLALRSDRGATDFAGSAEQVIGAATSRVIGLMLEQLGRRLADAPVLRGAAPPPARPAAPPVRVRLL